MKSVIFVFSIALLFSSCTVTKQTGQFKSPPGRREMTLTLKSDGTLDLNWIRANYTGNWTVLRKNHTLLKLDERANISPFISGPTLEKEIEIKFVNKNKIKMRKRYADPRYYKNRFKYIVLKRQK